MFVHLGGNEVVDVRDIVAILDVKALERSVEARGLLERVRAQTSQSVAPRAIVVTTRGLLPAQFATATVARRVLALQPNRRKADRTSV